MMGQGYNHVMVLPGYNHVMVWPGYNHVKGWQGYHVMVWQGYNHVMGDRGMMLMYQFLTNILIKCLDFLGTLGHGQSCIQTCTYILSFSKAGIILDPSKTAAGLSQITVEGYLWNVIIIVSGYLWNVTHIISGYLWNKTLIVSARLSLKCYLWNV